MKENTLLKTLSAFADNNNNKVEEGDTLAKWKSQKKKNAIIQSLFSDIYMYYFPDVHSSH